MTQDDALRSIAQSLGCTLEEAERFLMEDALREQAAEFKLFMEGRL